MKKLVLCITLFIAFIPVASAQTRQLIIHQADKGHYIDHSVAPKEGLYSIGRTYNVHPRTIAAFNNIDMNAGLNIGQVIHIPLTDTNFSQQTNKGIPVYYTVGEKEGLLTVSRKNMDVTMQSIRDWNRLGSDRLNVGTKLIVGFLVTEPVAPSTTPGNEAGREDVAKQDPPSVNEKPEEPIKNEPPVTKQDPPKNEPVKAQTPPVNQGQVTASGEGFFRYSFEQQSKKQPVTNNETVTSGIFKTTSGWQDAKYYLLIDEVTAGTIIRLINPDNNKAVYAKVLGEMNGIRQNQGLDIRISNAAAAALGIGDTEKFILKVNY